MTNPEEAKKLTIRPRQMDTKMDDVTEQVDLVSESAPAEKSFPSETEATPARKRPSPALRPAGSSSLRQDAADAFSNQSKSPTDSAANPLESQRSSRSSRRQKGLRAPVPVGVALVVAILLIVVSGFFFYSAGTRAGFQKAESGVVKEQVDLTEDFLARLDAALELLQNGNAKEALQQLQVLEKEEPEVATISLLIANAALLSDDPDTAQARIAESIRRRESISDALTLQAIVEAKLATDSEYKKMGSPKVRIEQLLRQAIAADSSNPRPHLELATLKRFEGKFDEAEAELLSARLRINAADSRMVADTALALTRLQKLPNADVSVPENPAPTPEALFSAAYSAMRVGDMPRAAGFLEAARGFLPENVFRQILKDPAFIPYTKEAALEGFFKKPGQSEKQ